MEGEGLPLGVLGVGGHHDTLVRGVALPHRAEQSLSVGIVLC